MTAGTLNLTIEQGATYVLSFVWHDDDGSGGPGTPRDLTGYTARMQVRKRQQMSPLVSLTSSSPTANGGKIVLGAIFGDIEATPVPANGRIAVYMTDEDTDLLVSKSAQYDLELEKDGVVWRVLKGTVTVDPNITQMPDDPEVGE